jgi:cyclic pyranopterin phosphate synthase
MMVDSFGRKIDYLRVSITDRCNLRCIYCMPLEGVEWKPHDSMLNFEEIFRICRIMGELGIAKIKVTGGDPLVRRGTSDLLKGLKALPGIKNVTLTTNGFLLLELIENCNGQTDFLPDAVNISLDACNIESFNKITRVENLNPSQIILLIDELIKRAVTVKINCVTIQGLNEEEILPLVSLAKDRNIAVRFIELMPFGSAVDLKPVSGARTASIIEKAFGHLVPFDGIEGNGPAVYYSLKDFRGKVGFINPLSHGFCETCNRLRLTSEGFLKPCLSSGDGVDLKSILRSGGSDNQLALAIKDAVSKKPKSHNLSNVYRDAFSEDDEKHNDGMFKIGG